MPYEKDFDDSPIKKPNAQSSGKIVKRRLYTTTNTNLGAPSKFDQFHEEIIKRARDGLSKRDRVGGLIHDSTYCEWINAGERDLVAGIVSQYSDFSIKIRKAEQEYRKGLLKHIKSQAPIDWKAAIWLLERSDPESYKLKDKVDMNQTVEISQKAILEIPDNARRKI